jgi:uncharacterized protein YdbL (DUF1318 family)
MVSHKCYFVLMTYLMLAACVTVNVYFPAAAAERAADRIIQDIYGSGSDDQESQKRSTDDRSSGPVGAQGELTVSGRLAGLIVPIAQAQPPNLTISTPGIAKLKASMKSRHPLLVPFYQSGAVGMTNNGLLAVRDIAAAPLADRSRLKQLVAEENRDRAALYPAIAEANGHPEWEREIRNIFASRWIANAPAGWWYQGPDGGWRQK